MDWSYFCFLDWPKADVILLSLGHGEKLSVFDNILLGGYTDDKNQMVLVKVFGDSFDVTSKVWLKYSIDKQFCKNLNYYFP